MTNIPTSEKSLFADNMTILSAHDNAFINKSWALPPLFKMSKSGQWRIWQIMFDDKQSRLIRKYGLLNGKKTETSKAVKTNKSGRNIYEQAYLQAKSEYNKQIDKNAHTFQQLQDFPKNSTQISASKTNNFEVMLAKEYQPEKIKRWPLAGQVKIDGIRAYAISETNGISLKSRNHKHWNWLEHIKKNLTEFLTYLPKNCILDGELYNHDLTFNQISSAVKRKKHKSSLNQAILYYIFDIFEHQNLTFECRYNILIKAYNKFIKSTKQKIHISIVPMTLLFSHSDVKDAEIIFTKQGFEGVILRHLGSIDVNNKVTYSYQDPFSGLNMKILYCQITKENISDDIIQLSQYKHGRSQNLLKYKTFQDEEAIVIDIVSGEGTKENAAILLLQDKRGNKFRVNPKGTIESHKKWLQNKHKYIGQTYTFKYQELSEYGVPRFPVGIAFRNYE